MAGGTEPTVSRRGSAPDPAGTSTRAEFIEQLRRLKVWAGDPSFQALQRSTGVPRATLSDALNPRRKRLPVLDVVVALVRGCGGTADDVHEWTVAWRRVKNEQSGPAAPTGPRQLPARIGGFLGRGDELRRLDALAESTMDGVPAAIVITAISGTAGVGKTALAVHWAHQVADRFPDGHLYVNLRGYDPGPAITPEVALDGFLRALGVVASAVPPDLDGRAAMYRSLLYDRRALVVLDNAGNVDQVRPLLPGSPGSVVVVTSRGDLPGLVARDGASRLRLDRLRLDDSIRLLARLLAGSNPDPAALAALAERCARLPLALRIAAERIARRPDVRLSDALAELDAEGDPLVVFSVGDDQYAALDSVFSWSYRDLAAPAARLFRLLGLHPGREADRYAAAALADCSPAEAARLLGVLRDAHLVEETRPGRFGTHDLLRSYAAACAELDETEPARRDAMTRLLDFYLHASAAAMDIAFPSDEGRRPRLEPSSRTLPDFGSAADATAWLDAERRTLLDTSSYALANDRTQYAVLLPQVTWRHHETGGHYADAIVTADNALNAARQAADLAGEASATNILGIMYRALGDYDRALERHETALDLRQRIGDVAGQAFALAGVALVHWSQGRNEPALGLFGRALDLHRTVGERSGAIVALNNMAIVQLVLGRYLAAIEHFELAGQLAREMGDRVMAAMVVSNLGLVQFRLGHVAEALDHHRRSLAERREIGDRRGEADSVGNIGVVLSRMGRHDDAVEHQTRSLAIRREIGDRAGEAQALVDLASACLGQRRFDAALDHARGGLGIAREIGVPRLRAGGLNALARTYLAMGRADRAVSRHLTELAVANVAADPPDQARALDGLGHAYRALGDVARARDYWTEAAERYDGLGLPEAAEIRAALADTHSPK